MRVLLGGSQMASHTHHTFTRPLKPCNKHDTFPQVIPLDYLSTPFNANIQPLSLVAPPWSARMLFNTNSFTSHKHLQKPTLVSLSFGQSLFPSISAKNSPQTGPIHCLCQQIQLLQTSSHTSYRPRVYPGKS